MKRHRWLRRLAWTSAALFLLASAALYLQYQSDRRLLARFAAQVEAGRTLSDEQRLALYLDRVAHWLRDPTLEEITSWPVRLYYMLSPLHPGPGDVLRWGSHYLGNCGSHSRVLVAMLESHGVPALPMLLLDSRGKSIHTVVQARIGGRWVVVDAAFGIVFHRRDGALATAADLAADTTFFRAQVDTVPGYPPEYGFAATTLFNWQKVPVVLPAARAVLEKILGPERVSQIRRPGIWMWPQAFYSLMCLGMSGALALWGWRLSRHGGE